MGDLSGRHWWEILRRDIGERCCREILVGELSGRSYGEILIGDLGRRS